MSVVSQSDLAARMVDDHGERFARRREGMLDVAGNREERTRAERNFAVGCAAKSMTVGDHADLQRRAGTGCVLGAGR